MNWVSITKIELEKEIESQCSNLDSEELNFFNKIRVPLEPVEINRWGKLETVFIVAKLGTTIIFYEDVEEGFEITKLNEQGVISEYGASQYTIQHVTNQLRARNS